MAFPGKVTVSIIIPFMYTASAVLRTDIDMYRLLQCLSWGPVVPPYIRFVVQ
ncbi:hypothetical protein SCP_0703000 [Sparassis crispa]|uniref:Uncharacterized protein n=1 Tax=Sparassis crispa TaxID=139825 RepID=A0A401GTQ1_9APHY|nr:hypothetical protein SCP_0703000 [Sparassis crispa]GBE85114.1 hypothetical protein SCP_0703000 [Sparassis crispa]